ncbi:unnamed protein product [Peronospora belbahrii]|uniref:Peptidase S54 rhomboid domain-containing protein n=1 Tax=Peronospora belbahrii TaxID=622444 RepID=A0AAU9L1Q1_9STRA|nr:unnamed protein product [Peronospora belbahrii]
MFRGLQGTSARIAYSNLFLQTSHVNTHNIRDSTLRFLSRQQQPKLFLLRQTSRHDVVLTASMGLVSGGILVTSVLHQHKEDTYGKDIITSLYEDGTAMFYRGNGRQFDKPWYDDTNKKVIALLIAANTMVFGLWRVSFRNIRLHQFMWRHFASSYDSVVFGKRFYTLLTSSFSHMTFPHFGINMFMLWEFGPHLIAPGNNHKSSTAYYNQIIANSKLAPFVLRDKEYTFRRGPELFSMEKFMAFYLTSAVISSALSAFISKLRRNGGVFSIGASGAVSAVFTVSCLMFPDERLLLYGLFEMTSTQMLQLYTALNLVGAVFQRHLRIDCVGHLGGQSAGFAFYQAPFRNEDETQ